MSSPSQENESGGEAGDNEDTIPRMEQMGQMQEGEDGKDFGELQMANTGRSGGILEILEEEIAAGVAEPEETVLTGKGYHEAEMPPTLLEERPPPGRAEKEEGPSPGESLPSIPDEIGRASCRERVCQYV